MTSLKKSRVEKSINKTKATAIYVTLHIIAASDKNLRVNVVFYADLHKYKSTEIM